MKIQLAVIALAATSRAFAAEPAAVSMDRVLACAGIADAATRLECFDRSVAATRAPPASTAPVTATPAVEAQPKAREQPQAPAEETVQAHITEARKANGGLYLIVLDNGQTWRHEQGSMEPYLKVGEAVTIRRGTLGSYRLTLDSGNAKNWVRVSRIR
jgi:hypothetical protein